MATVHELYSSAKNVPSQTARWEKRKAPFGRSSSLWELSARRRLMPLSTNRAGLVPASQKKVKHK
jgi:hypothetical protein